MFLFVIHLMMVWLRAETCSEWYVIINTRWNVVAKEGLVIPILPFTRLNKPRSNYKTTWQLILINTCAFLILDLLSRYINILSSRGSAVGIATGYGLDDKGVGIRVPVGSRIFISSCRPDRLWGPTNLSNEYGGSIPGVIADWAWIWPLTSK
jgi:hypothetical protein